MSEQSLIVRDDAKLAVSFSREAIILKDRALEIGALIGRVTNAMEQNAAVEAQTELQKIIGQAEKARKAVKAPVIEYGRSIDAAAEGFTAELKAEMLRISKLVSDFQQLELAKARAAEEARRLEAEKIERERQAELRRIAEAEAERRAQLVEAERAAQRLAAEAKNKKEREEAERQRLELERQRAAAEAQSHEQFDAVQASFNAQQAALSAQVHEPIRAEGQRVVTDWDVVVNDIHKLYRAHANCVELKPRISEIKNLLKMGVQVQGVTATPVVKAGVRLGKPAAAIDV